MADHSFLQDVSTEGLKAAPPVAVTGAIVSGMTINDWIAIATLSYLLLQIGLLLPKYWRLWIQERSGTDKDDDE